MSQYHSISMVKKPYTFSLDPRIIEELDARRVQVSRSKYLNDILVEVLNLHRRRV